MTDTTDRPGADPFNEILAARMEYALHGVPRERRARKRMRELLGEEIDAAKTDNKYDVLRR